ncbi:MAG: phosphatase PAP2 family protein [Actinomycetota bacterium]
MKVALALAAYVAAVGTVVWSIGGVPASRDLLVPVLLGGIAAASATSVARLRRVVGALLVDWAPFVLSLWLYDLVRGFADGNWMPVHVRPQIRVDEWIGLGSVPTVWLQDRLWGGIEAIHWWDYAAWAVYMSYFFVPTLVLAVLWLRDRALFRRLAAMVVGLAVAGCATYVLFPAAPPWWAYRHGALPPVHRIIPTVNAHVPVIAFQPLWETGTQYANDVAAVPSLHGAYTLLVVLFLLPRLRSRWRHLLWLYPAAMAFVLAYTGEHYVSDVLLGWVYAVAMYLAVERIALPRLHLAVPRRP